MAVDRQRGPDGRDLNVPVPDPSTLTTEALTSAIAHLKALLEAQIDAVRHDVDAFVQGHEEKHALVVNAAIAHLKALTEAANNHLQSLTETRLAASDLRYQQRYDAQSDALEAAFKAQQEATAQALAAAKEAVTTALASAEKAVSKAETATEKLIPRAEVEKRFEAVTTAISVREKVVDEHLQTIQRVGSHPVSLLSDKLEKLDERIGGLDRVTDAKFVTFRTLIDSQADKVALALEASTRAVDAAFASSATAIAKAESFNEKRFDLLSAQIDELKSYRDSSTGKGAGANAVIGFIIGGVGVIAAVVAIVLSFAGN